MIKNPLDELQNISVKYVLVAFEYTEDACQTDIGKGSGPPGTYFSGDACGKKACVIVNEFTDQRYIIDKFESEFNFFSAISPTSTQMVGELRINDRIGGQFPTFLRKVAENLNVSETHICFKLKTYFNGKNKDGIPDSYSPKPLIFNTGFITNAFNNKSQHFYSLFFLATYNTFGLMPTFSKMYQSTITNINGNPSKEVPRPDAPTSSLLPRAVEDSIKSPARKTRIDKSKTMETLGDVFDGLAEDLQQQKYEHKRQLQEWLSYVRDDYVKKIDQPKQVRPDGYIPVDYRLTLDGEYRSYKVDNRNMPFEQPEQSQEKYGVRSIPIYEGEHLITAVEKIMKYSRKVGKDAQDYLPKSVFKSNINIIRRCNGKYDLFLKVKKIILPTNTPASIDTGPGEGAVNPLIFEFQKQKTEDVDVEQIDSRLTSLVNLRMMETQVDDADAEVVFGNREQATAERTPEVDFFNSMFSGVRVNINNKNNGLESAEDAGKIDNIIKPNINIQTNVFKITTRCNAGLLSDISRNPFAVKNDDDDGALFYKKPEYYPMYAKIIMYLTPPANTTGYDSDDSDNIYYHTNYCHLYKIRTIITGNDFNQELFFLRTDDKT